MPRSTTALDAYVGSRISARRAALGLSQAALAQTIGVTFQQVQKYESGTNRVSASRLHAIAVALAASIATFFPPPASGDAAPDPEIDRPLELKLRLMLGMAEGRAIVESFPAIADASSRRAVARIVRALAVSA